MNVLCMKRVDIIVDLENFSVHCVLQSIFTVKSKVETFVDDECNGQYSYVWNNHNRTMCYQTTGVFLQNSLIWCENNSLCNCDLMSCTNNGHLHDIDMAYNSLVGVLQNACNQCFVRNNIVTWTQNLSLLKNECKFIFTLGDSLAVLCKGNYGRKKSCEKGLIIRMV